MRIVAGILLLVLSDPLFAQRNQIAGYWIGTFNGQPLPKKVKGGYPETITRFEMRLSEGHGKISGFFTNLDQRPLRPRRITNGMQWEAGAYSFEVLDSDRICTWAVTVQGDRLWGTRNSGRMSSIGIGSGVRLFGVRANRQSEEK
jgi:hypothetical protein